jgi:hypothetical protein
LEKTEKYREVHCRRQRNMGKYTGEERKIWGTTLKKTEKYR